MTGGTVRSTLCTLLPSPTICHVKVNLLVIILIRIVKPLSMSRDLSGKRSLLVNFIRHFLLHHFYLTTCQNPILLYRPDSQFCKQILQHYIKLQGLKLVVLWNVAAVNSSPGNETRTCRNPAVPGKFQGCRTLFM